MKRELDDTKQKLLEKSDSLLNSVQKGHEVWWYVVCVVVCGCAQSVCVPALQMMLETKRLTAELGQKEDELAKINDM